MPESRLPLDDKTFPYDTDYIDNRLTEGLSNIDSKELTVLDKTEIIQAQH